jgi:phospholipid-binding lipoprotein MlaA
MIHAVLFLLFFAPPCCAQTAQQGVETLMVTMSDDDSAVWWGNLEDEKNTQSPEERDPLEPVNRFFFYINRVVDGLLLKPAAIVYRDSVNDTAKVGISNAVDNAFAPLSVVNYTLQGNGQQATVTLFRFLINTTVGILGLVDVAKEMGLDAKPTTMNETLMTWGVEAGPYLMLPLIGPTTFRGAYGKLGDWVLNPMYYVVNNKHRQRNKHAQQRYIMYALYGLDIINRRAQLIDALNDVERNSLDPYVTVRSMFLQKQDAFEREVKKRNAA